LAINFLLYKGDTVDHQLVIGIILAVLNIGTMAIMGFIASWAKRVDKNYEALAGKIDSLQADLVKSDEKITEKMEAAERVQISRLAAYQTLNGCTVFHNAHDKEHNIEKEYQKETNERLQQELNGFGRRLNQLENRVSILEKS
jgi:uncharacterized protein YaaN involved in tellurite resistance